MDEPAIDQIEAGLNRIHVKTLQAKIERQAVQITRLEASRKGLKKHNRELRETLEEIKEKRRGAFFRLFARERPSGKG